MTERDITIESEYRGSQYHLLAVVGGSAPRRKWYDEYWDMLEAVEKKNPDRRFAWTERHE